MDYNTRDNVKIYTIFNKRNTGSFTVSNSQSGVWETQFYINHKDSGM
jgi:hypothetical protein